MSGPGILIVGHGTRNAVGCSQFLELAEKLKLCFPASPVEAAFLELATPSIEMGLEALARRGCKDFAVLPILLFEAGHAKSDVPNEVSAAADNLHMQCLGQSSPIAASDTAVQLSLDRFRESLQTQPDLDPEYIALCMIGRGASDPHATAQMEELVRKRQAIVRTGWSRIGYFAAARPTVDEVLADCLSCPLDDVFIQPHLLFEGQLTEELRAKVAQMRQLGHKRIHLVEALGSRVDVAQAYALEFAKNTRFRDIFPMNLG
jgi:sirohydrochlorin cobaltochelatase